MKIKAKKTYLALLVLCLFWVLQSIAKPVGIAKSNPSILAQRQLAFNRAKSLDNGISISWLEQTWNKNILNEEVITDADLALLKSLGFKSIRLPVAFSFWESQNMPLQKVLARIDKIISLCHAHNLKLVIDYHNGNINDANYAAETTRASNLWLTLTKRYINESADDVFFELYNEPPHMNPNIWKDAAYNLATAIRTIDKKRTLIIGASNFNSIYELSRMVRLADENIIYTFHFYEPFLFTHQGANWVGDPSATIGVQFPYNAEKFPVINQKTRGTWGENNYKQYPRDGNTPSLTDKLMIVKKWAAKYDVPILCGEYGAHNKYADLDSRCRYIKAMRKALKTLSIPGMLWDYNGTFSLFDGKPALKNLPACMADALGYNAKN